MHYSIFAQNSIDHYLRFLVPWKQGIIKINRKTKDDTDTIRSDICYLSQHCVSMDLRNENVLRVQTNSPSSSMHYWFVQDVVLCNKIGEHHLSPYSNQQSHTHSIRSGLTLVNVSKTAYSHCPPNLSHKQPSLQYTPAVDRLLVDYQAFMEILLTQVWCSTRFQFQHNMRDYSTIHLEIDKASMWKSTQWPTGYGI